MNTFDVITDADVYEAIIRRATSVSPLQTSWNDVDYVEETTMDEKTEEKTEEKAEEKTEVKAEEKAEEPTEVKAEVKAEEPTVLAALAEEYAEARHEEQVQSETKLISDMIDQLMKNIMNVPSVDDMPSLVDDMPPLVDDMPPLVESDDDMPPLVESEDDMPPLVESEDDTPSVESDDDYHDDLMIAIFRKPECQQCNAMLNLLLNQQEKPLLRQTAKQAKNELKDELKDESHESKDESYESEDESKDESDDEEEPRVAEVPPSITYMFIILILLHLLKLFLMAMDSGIKRQYRMCY
jgi:hypothetical protein